MLFQKRMPATIYESPEDWGNETYYMNEGAMRKNVSRLRKLGGDWKNTRITECDSYTLWFETDSKVEVYRLDQSRGDNYYVFASTGGGYFDRQEYDEDEHGLIKI